MIEDIDNFKTYNYPEKINNNFNDFHKKLILDIYKILSEFVHQKEKIIKKISFAFIYNRDINFTINPIKYDNNINLYVLKYPIKIDKDLDIKNSVFRAKLDFLIKKIDFKSFDFIVNLNIFIIYNENIDEIKLFSDFDKTSNNDYYSFNNIEGLPFYSSIEPKYSLNQVVLNNELLDDINKTIVLLNQRNIIYNDWGFSSIDPVPKAILNFYGPSGTGKTMTAHAISKEIGCKLLALNYAEIESKFVGDAPKNLIRAFETASKENLLLFFDEADSFLGRRITNVSSSSDQAVNSLRSQMLILLENFDGFVIFASNLIVNYDRAFESRIFKHLKFELPNDENREKIILKSIPKKVPFYEDKFLDALQIDNLVKISGGFSGREIKNAILESLCNAIVNKRKYVLYSDFETSFQEMNNKKNKLNEEYKTTNISSERKKELENKIQNEIESKKIKTTNLLDNILDKKEETNE